VKVDFIEINGRCVMKKIAIFAGEVAKNPHEAWAVCAMAWCLFVTLAPFFVKKTKRAE
jgi:hypothetical protein